jgi:transcriptional regulator with XRE-family HTH domain
MDDPNPDGWPASPSEFAAALRQARQLAGLTLRDLAERTDIPVRILRDIEAGRHRKTSWRRRTRLRRVLDAAQRERDSGLDQPLLTSRRLIVDLTGFSAAQLTDTPFVLRGAVGNYLDPYMHPAAYVCRRFGPESDQDPEVFERHLATACRRKRLASLLFDRLCAAKVEPRPLCPRGDSHELAAPPRQARPGHPRAA